MSLATSRTNYNKAFNLYKSIDNQWNTLETGKSVDAEYDINKLSMDLKSFNRYINGVQLDDLYGTYDEYQIADVIKNLKFFKEALFHIERNIKAIKYADELPVATRRFISNMNLPKSTYSAWADDENELTKKFIATITKSDNILDYENEIRRLMKGKMSQKEFEKIYDVLKRSMIRLPSYKYLNTPERRTSSESFESLNIYIKKELSL